MDERAPKPESVAADYLRRLESLLTITAADTNKQLFWAAYTRTALYGVPFGLEEENVSATVETDAELIRGLLQDLKRRGLAVFVGSAKIPRCLVANFGFDTAQGHYLAAVVEGEVILPLDGSNWLTVESAPQPTIFHGNPARQPIRLPAGTLDIQMPALQ